MTTEQPGRLASPLTEELGPLVACPLCGAGNGYTLSEGSTYRWWDVHCAGCGELVAECASDRRTQLGTYLPTRWPDADQAWNTNGAYAHKLRTVAVQVLADMRAQGVLLEWQTLLADALGPNARAEPAPTAREEL